MSFDNRGNYDYGLDPVNNRILSMLEGGMIAFDKERHLQALKFNQKDALEIIDTCNEGIKYFEKASENCCPLQRVMVGICFTMNALKEWREKGPLNGY